MTRLTPGELRLAADIGCDRADVGTRAAGALTRLVRPAARHSRRSPPGGARSSADRRQPRIVIRDQPSTSTSAMRASAPAGVAAQIDRRRGAGRRAARRPAACAALAGGSSKPIRQRSSPLEASGGRGGDHMACAGGAPSAAAPRTAAWRPTGCAAVAVQQRVHQPRAPAHPRPAAAARRLRGVGADSASVCAGLRWRRAAASAAEMLARQARSAGAGRRRTPPSTCRPP